MGRERRTWREACESTLCESDPKKLLGCIEDVVTALERRYAEWKNDPGTPDELNSIQEAIFAVERHMKDKLKPYGTVFAGGPSDGTRHSVAAELRQVRRLFLILRP